MGYNPWDRTKKSGGVQGFFNVIEQIIIHH